MPVMLKNKWTRDICKVSCRASGEAANAARRAVVVVPMLDPRVSGYTRSIEMTPMPTSGVRVEVKTELDWTIKVIPAPTASAK